MELNCPQCLKSLKPPSFRLVQDSCGHKKCRMCLLQDESECKLCVQQNVTQSGLVKKEEETVIKYENNHTAVITCNKFKVTLANAEQQQIKNGSSNVDTLQQIENKDETVAETNSKNKNHEKRVNILNTKSQTSGPKRSYKFITLPNHISIFTENPLTYKCGICNKSFRTKSHVRYHSYCAGGEKPLKCEACNKEFISKYHLETHLLSHTQKKQYVCDICKKGFSRYGKLNRHKLIHSESKQFVCQLCGKMFASKEYLQKHTVIHKAEKPYACPLCKTKFNSRSNLNKHRASHSKDKIHMCDECGKRFKLKGALTVHRRSHLRIRPYKCNDCSKTFINAKELHRHQLIHIDTKNYACSLCGISFRRKDNLQRHIRNTHPGKKATLIKKPVKRIRTKRPQLDTPAENPNAIKVITAPPAHASPAPKVEPVLSKPVPVINAPLKLAFKTTAFKSHYNIHSRECNIEPPRIHSKPYDYAESVSICQKILSPSSPPPRTIIKTLGKVSEKESTEICQKILSPIVPPVNDTIVEKTHSIRNIKFKLPSKYINLSKKNIFNDIVTSNPRENSSLISQDLCGKNNTYTDLKPVSLPLTNGATSVIVNTNSTNQNEMHWRRRTLQNLELQSKSSDN